MREEPTCSEEHGPESDLTCLRLRFSISKMGRWSLSCRVVGEIRDKVYELPHGRYSKVAMDIKELGLGKGRTGETAWSPLGTALLAMGSCRRILSRRDTWSDPGFSRSLPEPMEDGRKVREEEATAG